MRRNATSGRVATTLLITLLFLSFAQARDFNGMKGIEQLRNSDYYWKLLQSSFFGANPQATGSGGGTACAGCTGVIAMVEQLALIHNEPILKVLEKFCGRFPFPINRVCRNFVEEYGAIIINMIELRQTPDRICQEIGVCTNPACSLFPPPLTKLSEQNVKFDFKKLIKPAKRFPPINETVENMINRFVEEHEPFFDLDEDKFSDFNTLRGYAWRGRDCDDNNKYVYPGRKNTDQPPEVDSNCNGIYGSAPDGTSYETLLCSETPYYGTAILGDSAAAHFHIPPDYVSPLNITKDTYKNLIPILTNEFDWPEMSATTGYTENNWIGHPIGPVISSYLYAYERNRCTFRDYQNIGVNGARTSSMANSIMYGFARNQTEDFPVILTYALIGNDVCNSHPGMSHMTTPEEFYDNVLTAMQYLDTQLPAGSQVILMGLANGLVLWDAMHARIHPLGELRQDVTYADLYDYLNCLEISPCSGWLNSNETMRLLTQARADELSATYHAIIENNSFKNFNMTYIKCPVEEVVDIWVANGGESWQLIEPVDGFHPNQIGNALIAEYVWKYLSANHPYLIPPENPNNEQIKQLFGDQGGY